MNARIESGGVARALRRKDGPWITLFVTCGLIAFVAAIGDGGFFHSLVFDKGSHQNVFHTAWISGLALGLVAAVFDTVLGLRDQLRQRPVSATQLFAARLRAIGLVLAVWFVFAPLLGWCWMLMFESAFGFGWQALLSLWSSMFVAVTAAMIGLFAGSLPLAWWLRPLVAAAALVTVFSAIDQLARPDGGFHAPAAFVAMHAGVALLLGWLTWSVRDVMHDADRAWPTSARLGAGTAAAAVLAAFAAGGLGEMESTAAHWLWFEYPVVVVHAGEVKLADRNSRWRNGGVVMLDGDHAPTGVRAPRADTRDVDHGWRRSSRDWLGFDRPRWHRGVQTVALGAHRLYLARDGHAWQRRLRKLTRLEPVGIGPGHAPFPPGSRLFGEQRRRGGWTMVHDEVAGALYRYDNDKGHFVAFALPGGDRLERVSWTYAPEFFPGSEPRNIPRLHGEKATYVPRGDELVVVEPEPQSPQSLPRDVPGIIRGGPIVATVEVPAADGYAAFTHEFRPRTFAEYAYAAIVVLLAGVQSPVVMLIAAGIGTGLLALAVALLSAWSAWSRLRRIGAPREVRQYWAVLCVIAGPVALFASVLFERRRAHAPRSARMPAAPRITTPLSETA